MAYNGSGTFNVYTPGTPYVTGTVISSTVANAVNSDFATGLSNAICKDGQSTPTANIPLGGFKLTGLAAGTANGNSVRYEQVGALALAQGAAASGANNDITSLAALTNSTDFRNVLINADFRINQRAYVSAATLAAGSYAHDRWKAGASGGDYSFTQLVSSTQITIAAAKSLIQVVEDKNVVGGSYVLSWTGTAQARYGLNSATPSGSYAASPILITGQTAGTTMSVEFNAGTLSNAQLELGAVASKFENRPYRYEWYLCRRHCRVIPSGEIIGSGTVRNSTASYLTSYAALDMRANPTLTFASTNLQLLVGASIVATSSSSSLTIYGTATLTVTGGGADGQAAAILTGSTTTIASEL